MELRRQTVGTECMLENKDMKEEKYLGGRSAAVGMPFIMPDGRPLSVWLSASNEGGFSSNEQSKRRKRSSKNNKKKKRREQREPCDGWTSSSSQWAATTAATSPHLPPSDAEQSELEALEKVGQRRQRRWLNDKLLRDMTPSMTAKEMQGLFQPAPFGDTGHVSIWTLASESDIAPLWEVFRSVDMDMQERVLQKWRDALEREQIVPPSGNDEDAKETSSSPISEKSAQLNAIAAAHRGWAAIGHCGRKALRKAPFSYVQSLEGQIVLLFGDNAECEGGNAVDEVVFVLENAFERLLVHSLAAFHFLSSSSREAQGHGKKVVVRFPNTGKQNRGSLPCGHGRSADFDREHRILCSQLLWLLDEDKSDISPQSLYDMLCDTEGLSV